MRRWNPVTHGWTTIIEPTHAELKAKAELADRLARLVLDTRGRNVPTSGLNFARQILALSAGEPAPQTEGPMP